MYDTIINFPVLCETGVYADAKTGFKIIWDENNELTFAKKKVNKKLVKPEYTDIYKVRSYGRKHYDLIYEVYSARTINKHGLQWQLEYTVTFCDEMRIKNESGNKDFIYWTSNKLGRWIKPGMIEVNGEEKLCFKLNPKDCMKYICGFSDIYDFWNGNINAFLQEWYRGDLKKRFEPDLKKFKFGVELEFTGMPRAMAANVLAKYFDSCVTHYDSYDKYIVKDRAQRSWSIVKDASIDIKSKVGIPADTTFMCELVTPVLEYDDIPTLQCIVRKLRQAGMSINPSCGIHVHVEVKNADTRVLRNILKIIAGREELLYKALDVKPGREEKYCKKLCTTNIFSYIKRTDDYNTTMAGMKDIWYRGNAGSRTAHYNDSRYRGINLHSFYNGTGIEFRFFNSTSHAGRVKAYIQLCLAMTAYAYSKNIIKCHRWYKNSDKIVMRNFLNTIGLKGDEFKTARYHLLKKFEDEENVDVANVG